MIETATTASRQNSRAALQGSPALPSGWQLVAVAEVATVRGGYGFPVEKQGCAAGDYPFYKVSDMNSVGNETWMDVANHYVSDSVREQLRAKPFPTKTIVFPKVGAAIHTNKKRILSRSALIDNNLMGVTVEDGGVCDPEYLLRWFQSINISDLSSPGALPSITATRVQNTKLLLPPIREQRAIVQTLKTLQHAKEAMLKSVAAGRQIKASLSKHLFAFGRVPPKESHKVHVKESAAGVVPAAWSIGRIEEYIQLAQYGLSVRGEQVGKYPILRMNGLKDGRVHLGSLQYVNLDADTFESFRLEPGDVLFNRTNSFELVGKTAIFDHPGEFVFASYLVRLRLDADRLDPRYLNHYLNYGATQSRLKSLASRGVSQSNINASKLKTFLIPVPPVEQQKAIADDLDAVDSYIAATSRKSEALGALFTSLLDRLMTGKVRVGSTMG